MMGALLGLPNMSNDRTGATETDERDAPWALVNRPIADLMFEPSVASERVSQALLGEACRVLDHERDWAKVRLERDAYVGWLHRAALHPATKHDALDYLGRSQVVIGAEIAQAHLSREDDAVAGKLFLGLNLPLADQTEQRLALRLPDGRVWWIASSDALPLSERAVADAGAVDRGLQLMRRSVGVPYLWGGRTPFGYDCSGLSQAFYGLLGVGIPRDAHQQFQVGRAVEGAPAPGDLIFFSMEGSVGEAERHANVRHVGISLGGDQMLHASGKLRSVVIERLSPGVDAYTDWLFARIAGVRKFGPCV